MKKTLIVLALIFGMFSNSYSSDKIIRDFDLNSFSKTRVVLEVPFGKSNILNPQVLDEIKKKQVEKITLVYTTYKEADKFSQERLNDKRLKNLYEIFSSAKQFNIEYIGVEKCVERSCAQNQLHGFVIEYKTPALHYSLLETQKTTIQANQDCMVTGKQGTFVQIEANSFEDLNGNSIEGEISLELIEAYSPKDIVKANLITITDKGEALQSDGMIQVKAYADNKELRLKSGKSMSVEMPRNTDVDDMKVWEGNWVAGELVWENPEELNSNNKNKELTNSNPATSIKSESNIEVLDTITTFNNGVTSGTFLQKFDGLIIYDANYREIDNKINEIHLRSEEEDYKYHSNTYTVKMGLDSGLSKYQAKTIKKWFSESKVPEIADQRFFGWTYIWINSEENVQDVTASSLRNANPLVSNNNNFNTQNSKLNNTFQMKNLGWANIDRLATFPNSRTAKLEVKCNNDSLAENITISLLIPERNIYLPGYKMASGNYCFSHGDYEKKYSLPIGDKAFVIMMGNNDKIDYSVLHEIELGKNKIESVDLEKSETKTFLKKIDKLI